MTTCRLRGGRSAAHHGLEEVTLSRKKRQAANEGENPITRDALYCWCAGIVQAHTPRHQKNADV